jgi:hypothetical protein
MIGVVTAKSEDRDENLSPDPSRRTYAAAILIANLEDGMIALLKERQYNRALLRSPYAERQIRREPERAKISCLENVGKRRV